ncbi:MAG: sodium:solute symporter [Ignavibacteriales bacterium CG18_big_fil_WC_8_21_14_2_50_31_20]|nr:MAG: sodium:solute symporter [Ignavibacteriales bacterium CG18_big_fil_WC_8_21_14_2_50_31_20]
MVLIDYLIVFFYLTGMIIIGLYFQKKASSGIDSYFLGNRKMPWWVLGASGMASNLDVSGTMINVALLYAFGAVGFFIEIRGGIVLIMAFFMIYMGKWNRRSKVMTLAEWMRIRFGEGREGKIARLITAIAIITSTIAIITYFSIGAGKFIGEFLDFPELFGLPSEFWAASLMIVLAMTYTVSSGLYGVVWTDVFQGFLILTTILVICYIAFTQFVLPDSFTISVPSKIAGFIPIETTRSQWTNIIPSWKLDMPENSAYSIYNLFGVAIIFYVIKTIIEGAGGTGGYMAQRFFASRSDRDAGLLSLFWIFLLSFRWPFIIAIAIMGISYGATSGQVIQDPEKVLPIVILQLVPLGVRGLLVAGLMAAAMSTFDSLVNSGSSYWVKDIYQAFINPTASEKQLVKHSRWASVLMVLAGLFMTLNITSINEIWGWFNMGIGAGLIMPLLIRWYWWRLNGYGFAAGIAGGMSAAFIQKIFFAGVPEYYSFLFVTSVSLAAILVVTLLTKPTNEKVLLNFYKVTRPFGFWNKIKMQLNFENIDKINKENRRDIIATSIAIIWQLVLFIGMMTVILKRWDLFLILSIIFIVLSIGLYYFWYRHLSNEVRFDK